MTMGGGAGIHSAARDAGDSLRVGQSATAPTDQSQLSAELVRLLEVASRRLLLSDHEGAALLGVGLTSFHQLRSQPFFPKPVILSRRTVKWSRHDLEAAIANMPRQELASEPHQLLRARVEKFKRGAQA
jgi:predicted DNA-binding transcriptional regulator AlpA